MWFQRKSYFVPLRASSPTRSAVAVNRLCTEVTLDLHLLTRPKPLRAITTYGSAGRRTPEQQAAAYAYATEAIGAYDRATTFVAFTDGSAIGNPGPSGAGALVHVPPASGLHHTEEIAVSLGHGTNNLGELWAIAMTIQYADSLWRQGHTGCNKGVIFTDSAYARGCLLKGWTTRTYPKLISSLRQLLRESPISWDIIWVPGHAGVDENEVADTIANRASAASKDGRRIDVDTHINNLTFYNVNYL